MQRRAVQVPVDELIPATDWHALTPLVARVCAEPEVAMERLRRYVTLLLDWNRTVSNLVSRQDEHRVVSRHISESIEPAAWLKETGAKTWIDFGSGAGLPAIPLAIIGVGERWTLVESRRPKTLFMRKVQEELGLEHIDVYHGRLDGLIAERLGARDYDGFTSRATMRLAPTLELAKSIVMKDGCAFLWKGTRRDEELEDRAAWDTEWDFVEAVSVGDGGISVAKFKRKN